MKCHASAIVAGSILLVAAAGLQADTTAATPAMATPGTATTGPHGELRLPGQTEPVAKVEVPAGIHGLLASVDVKQGQLVKKGQQLAKLDDSIQTKEVELAELEAASDVKIKAAEVTLDFARNEYTRIKEVQSASETEKRTKELTVAQYELEVAKAKEDQKMSQLKLQEQKITLDKMTIRSPIDGAVLRVNKQAGEETDDLPLIVVVQVNKLNVVFYPPRQVFGKVKVGDKYLLDFATEPPLRREAVVVAVDPIIEQSLFQVKFELDNSDAKVPAGTSATWTWGGAAAASGPATSRK